MSLYMKLCPEVLPYTPQPTLPPAASTVDHLKVLDQLLGLDLQVHLVLALVSLQQLLIGQLKSDLAACGHIHRHRELLQLPPRGPAWGTQVHLSGVWGSSPNPWRKTWNHSGPWLPQLPDGIMWQDQAHVVKE